MNFSVIYSADTQQDTPIAPFCPPPFVSRSKRHPQPVWTQTEGDASYEYDYLADDPDDPDDPYLKGHHVKFCAVLTERQFVAFLAACLLASEDVETMGSLGAPGFGYGIVPAISFRYESDGCDGCIDAGAYVTPILTTKREMKRYGGDDGFDKAREDLIERFKDGACLPGSEPQPRIIEGMYWGSERF